MTSINLYEGIEQSEPAGFYKHFAWVKAFEDWRTGEPEALAEMMNDYVGGYLAPVPKEMAHLLTAIITGQVKPNLKSRSKVKPTIDRNYKGEEVGRHKMKQSEILNLMFKLETNIKLSKFLSAGQGLEQLQNYVALKGGKAHGEIDLHHSYDKLAVRYRAQLAKKKGVDVETVIKWEKYYKKLKKDWPNIWGF